MVVADMSRSCAAAAPVRIGPGVLRGLPPWAGIDDAVVVGEHDGGGAVPHAQLGEDRADVCLDGRLAHDEGGSDLGVGGAAGHVPQDVVLALGQLLDTSSV